MSQNGMLLQRYTGKPPGSAHDEEIISIRPNLRWTSDGFEIACWNSQVVRVAFALDTCDREVMAWCASTGGVRGEMIRNLLLESVERRFGTSRTSAPVQWLSDSSSSNKCSYNRIPKGKYHDAGFPDPRPDWPLSRSRGTKLRTTTA